MRQLELDILQVVILYNDMGFIRALIQGVALKPDTKF